MRRTVGGDVEEQTQQLGAAPSIEAARCGRRARPRRRCGCKCRRAGSSRRRSGCPKAPVSK